MPLDAPPAPLICNHKTETSASIQAPLDLGQWTPTPVKKLALPVTRFSPPSGIEIRTEKNAGGWAWPLPCPVLPPYEVSWAWHSLAEPSLAPAGVFSFLKSEADDSALRVGLVIDSGQEKLPVSPAMAQAFGKKPRLSGVVFYQPARTKGTQKKCTRSPLSEQIAYCEIANVNLNEKGNVTVTDSDVAADGKDSSGALVGLWIFADSDDSQSSSRATLEMPVIKTLQSPNAKATRTP